LNHGRSGVYKGYDKLFDTTNSVITYDCIHVFFLLYTYHMIVSYYLLPGPVTSIDFCGMSGGVSKIFQFVLSLPIIVSGSPMELPYAPWDCTVYLRKCLKSIIDADKYSIHRAYGKYVQKAYICVYTFLILLLVIGIACIAIIKLYKPLSMFLFHLPSAMR